MEEKEQVYWNATGQNGFVPGWVGDGECDVMDVSERDGFGVAGNPGPAARIRLKARGNYTVWVPVAELESV